MPSEHAVLSFVRDSIRSAWALELLLLLQRDPTRSWERGELVRELRGSGPAVHEALAMLDSAGLIAAQADAYRYAPATPENAELVAALAGLYAEKPIAVLRTIFSSPTDKIRSFADAFLFKKPDK